MACLFAFVTVISAFQAFTHPERIRRIAESYLESIVNAQVHVGSASFDLFEGIRLVDVRLRSAPGGGPAGPDDPPSRLVFSADSVQLVPEAAGIFRGNWDIERIIAASPTFVLEWNEQKKRYNWQDLLTRRPEDDDDAQNRLPQIHLRQARVRLRTANRAASRPAEGIENLVTLDVLAATKSTDPNQVVVTYRNRSGPFERGTIELDRPTGTIELTRGVLPSLPINRVVLAAPVSELQTRQEWVDLLNVQGLVGGNELSLRPAESTRLAVTIRDGSLSYPLDEVERHRPIDDRFFRFTGVNGEFIYDQNQAEADFHARLGGTRCQVRATARRVGPSLRTLDDVELSVHIRCEDLLLPRDGPEASIGEAHVLYQYRQIRHFYDLFSPSGRADIDLRIVKPAGKDAEIRLDRLLLTFLDGAASYANFPYRIEGLTGGFEISRGKVILHEITGYHGPARVVVTGQADLEESRGQMDIHIAGTNVPLDGVLYRCLPDRYKRMWRQFAPTGLAHVQVRLTRPGRQQGIAQPLRTEIDADLFDAEMSFRRFPYRVSRLTGRLQIAGDQLRFQRFRGVHDEATVLIDGWAVTSKTRRTRLELRLQAENVALDEDLRHALPPGGKETLSRFDPSGRADIVGRIYGPGPTRNISYDLIADLQDVSMHYQELPYRIENVSGILRITPEALDVLALHGAHGPAEIGVTGGFAIGPDATSGELALDCRGLELDDELFNALPAGLGRIRDQFAPRGKIDLDLRIEIPDAREDARRKYTAAIKAIDNKLTYRAFPIPLEEVTGTILAGEEKVVFKDITARSGNARFEISGEYDLKADSPGATFAVKARNVPFDENLRQALPWRLRRYWNDLRPTGAFDLDLREVVYQKHENQPDTFTFDGTWRLKDVSMNLGFPTSHLSGTVTASGGVGGQGEDFSVGANLNLSEATIADRRVTHLRGRLRRDPNSQRLAVEDLAAEAYGGQVSASGEAVFANDATAYKISMIARGLGLGPFLNAGRKEQEKLDNVAGRLDAALYLSGRTNDPRGVKGGGEVTVYDAQLVKVPLLLTILRVANLALPDERVFQDLHSSFYLIGKNLHFRRMELRGAGLAMLGTGRMDLTSRELDLQLYSVTPHDLPRLPLITEFLEGASRELMEILVTGPIDEPRIAARPLRSVEGTLRVLLGGQAASGR